MAHGLAVRALSVAGVVAVAVGLLPATAFAAAPGVLFVSASNGSDANDCTSSAPCATVQRAVEVAGTAPTTVEVGAGTYDGPITIAAGQQIVLNAYETDFVNLSSPDGSTSATLTNDGTLSLDNFTVDGSPAIEQDSGTLHLLDTQTGPGAGGVFVEGGSVDVATSMGFGPDGLEIQLDAGALTVSNTYIDSPIVQTGGHMLLYGLISYAVTNPLQVSGGTATIEDSELEPTYNGAPALAVTGTANVTVDRSDFYATTASVSGPDAVLTMLASSVYQPSAPLTATDGGALRLAASVIDDGSVPACAGQVVDGGYNSAYGTSCHFDAVGSSNSAARFQLSLVSSPKILLWDYAGPLDILVPLQTVRTRAGTTIVNPLIDAIPASATALFDPTAQLCLPNTTTDEIGQSAPVANRCDIGAIELGPSSVQLTALPVTVHGTKELTLTARLHTPLRNGFDLDGEIVFASGGKPVKPCRAVRFQGPTVVSCTVTPTRGAHTYTAAYLPFQDLHTSVSRLLTVTTVK